MSTFIYGEVVEAAEKLGGGSDLEPGIYTLEIVSIKDGVMKNDASVKTVSVRYRVTEGPDKGKTAFANYNSKGIGFKLLAKDLNTLGISNEELKSSDSEALTNKLAGTAATVEVSTSEGNNGRVFTNYSVVGVASAPTGEQQSTGSFPFGG